MKKVLLTIGIVCAGLYSCTDDDLIGKSSAPAQPGEEIHFSAFQQESEVYDTDNRGVRTHYGLYTDATTYNIYWDDGDEIAIYCPQARATKPDQQDLGRETDYKILLPNEESQTSQVGTLNKINPSDVGLQWGNEDMHDFFGFYPKSAKEGIIDATHLKLKLPVLQTPSAMRVIEPGGDISVVYPGKDTPVTGKTYIARPNMNSCFMYAHSQGSRLKGDSIKLQFNPIVTTLEAVICGPETGSIEVSQVVFRSDKSICGSFSLKIDELSSGQDGLVEAIDDATLSNTITIPVYYNHTLDSEGVGATTGDNLQPVKLGPGDVLVVRAFMLPEDVSVNDNNAITVHMVGAGTRTKILNQGTIQAKKMNITTLPKLKKSESNYWMTMLDEKVYFSQLSIPGSHNAYNCPATTGNSNFPDDDSTIGENYQTKDIAEQLNNGARAFSFQVGFSGDPSNQQSDAYKAIQTSGWNAAQGTYPLYVYAGGTQTTNKLGEVLSSFAKSLKELNEGYKTKYPNSNLKAQEFLVLNITYTERGNRTEETQRWLKEIDETIDNFGNVQGVFTNDIDDQTTIGDLAGKIIVFVNYQGKDWPTASNESTDIKSNNNGNYGYNPSTDATYYVVLKDTYKADETPVTNFSSMNDRDYNFVFYQPTYGQGVADVRLYRQNLERLNNTNLTNSEVSWLGDRQTLKYEMMDSLFKMAVTNNADASNVGYWYFNNIGSFCVVNKSESYATNRGQGGNAPMAANLMNYHAYQYLANSDNNTAPCGVVLMNFVGEENVGTRNVYSQALQQIIIENNYRFPLKVRGGSSAQMKAKLPPSDF